MKRPFAVIGFTIFFTIAILFNFEIGVAVTALCMFAVALIVSFTIRKIREDGFLPTFFASGALACVLLISSTYFTYLPALAYDGQKNCSIRAEIIGLPEIKYGNYYYNSRVISINGEPVDMKVRLSFSTPPEVDLYDIVEGSFNLYALGTTDESIMQSYKAQGLFMGAYPSNDAFRIIDIPERDKPFMKKILDIRISIIKAIYRVFPDERGDLAVALIIGDRSGLDDDIYSDFQKTGISHVICVSGYHLSLWSMLILKILKKTKLNDKLAGVIAAAGVLFFMLVSGMSYSVVRSGIMMFVFLFRNIIMRRGDSLNSLGFALAVMAVINPFSMGSVSLQLSALATMGIILYSLHIESSIENIIDKIKFNHLRKAVKVLAASLMVTASAIAFTMPLSLVLYRSFNFICFYSNLIAVPVSSFCMVICSIAALFGAVLPMLFNPFVLVGGAAAKFLIDAAHDIAQYDFLTFRINVNQTVILLSGIFAFCLIAVFISMFRKPLYPLSAALVSIIFTVSFITMSYINKNETKLTVFDFGNATSVLVSYKGENILIGCAGENFLGPNKIIQSVSDSGDELNYVVMLSTEEGADEYAFKVFSEYRPMKIYCDSVPENTEVLMLNTPKYSIEKMNITENISAKSIVCNNNYCILTKTEDVSVLICFNPILDFDMLPADFQKVDLVISRGDFPKSKTGYNGANLVLISDAERAEYIRNSVNKVGLDFVSTGGEGDIIIRAEDGYLNIERE